MSRSHQQNQELQAAADAPDQFFRELEIQFLIHELKDPIAIIETGLRTLLERREKFGPLSPKQENTLKRTLRNTKKTRSMLNNLLEIGRSQSGCFICSHFRPAKSVFQTMKEALEITTGPWPKKSENIKPKKMPLNCCLKMVFSLIFHHRRQTSKCSRMRSNFVRSWGTF